MENINNSEMWQWKTFNNDNGAFMIRINKTDNIYSISLTNFEEVWSSDFSKESLVEEFNVNNPLVDVKIDDAFLEVLRILNEVEKNNVQVSFTHSAAHIRIVSNVPDFKFKVKYEFELESVQKEKFAEMITMPMIQTIHYLEKQQHFLSNLLINKDRELQEYVLEKGKISRDDLVTERFDSSILKTSSNKLMLNVFRNLDQFSKYNSIQNSDDHKQVQTVEVEPWNNVPKRKRIWNSTKAKRKIQEAKITYKS